MFLKEKQRLHLYKKIMYIVPKKVTVTPWNEGKVGCPGRPCALNSGGREKRVVKKVDRS